MQTPGAGSATQEVACGLDGRYRQATVLREEGRRIAACNLRRLRCEEGAALGDIEETVAVVLERVFADPRFACGFEELAIAPENVFRHGVRVGVLSVILGIELGFAECDLAALALGAILHDVGKSFIPGSILDLPRKLTEEEYEEVRKHPVLGFEVLKRHSGLDIRAAYVAYQHHERFDGKGYPRGLAGSEIHKFARVVSVADMYDAVRSPRPYRDPLPAGEAIALIAAECGAAFDPEVVGALRRRLGRRNS